MKMKYSMRLLCIVAMILLIAALAVACTQPDTPETNDPNGEVTTVDPTGSADTEADTDASTEAETDYDIVQGQFIPEPDETYINVKDYGAKGDGKTNDVLAIREAASVAQQSNGVLFFPEGTYLIKASINIPANNILSMKIVGQNATLVGSDKMEGPLLNAQMNFHFYIYDMNFVHNGQGSCVDARFINAQNCRFTNDAENTAPVVNFHGSDCRFTECSFDVNNPDAYALTYIKEKDMISINDFIVDSVFRGVGKGILVGDGEYPEDGRCEGLKINGNYFYNTGSEQIRVTEILHINIAHNVMKGCTGTSIVLTQAGHGADGVYINDNTIENNGLACIASVEGGSNYVSSVNINNNLLIGGQYGVYDPIIFVRAFVRSNEFRGQTVAGYYTGEVTASTPYYLFDNYFVEGEGVYSLQMNIRGRTLRLARNVVGELNVVNKLDQDVFDAGCTIGGEKGDDVNRLDPLTPPDKLNDYKGEENIGNEIPPEEEKEIPMNVPIVSNDPVEAPLYHPDGGYGIQDLGAMHITDTVTMHFAATAAFDYIRIVNPSWGDSKGSIHVELYAWAGSYDATLAGTPVATADWIDFNDNNHNHLYFDEPQAAGQYMMVMSIDPAKVTEMVGFYVQGHDDACMRVYVNGVWREDMELCHTFIHYTQTPETNYWPASKGS